MAEQHYDYVDFMGSNGESDKLERVCRVYMTNGKLSYEGHGAADVKKLVDKHPALSEHRKLGGFALLSALPQIFTGSHFHATKVKEAYEEDSL